MKWQVEIDEPGRILIPSELRAELKLRLGQKLKMETRGDKTLVIQPLLDSEESIGTNYERVRVFLEGQTRES